MGSSQKEFSIENAYVLLLLFGIIVTKDKVMHSWYNLWLSTMFNDDDKDDGD